MTAVLSLFLLVVLLVVVVAVVGVVVVVSSSSRRLCCRSSDTKASSSRNLLRSPSLADSRPKGPRDTQGLEDLEEPCVPQLEKEKTFKQTRI